MLHVSHTTDDEVEVQPQAVLRLRVDRFDLMTRILGCETELARAELIGMDYRSIWRARNGAVGTTFAANTVAALREHSAELAKYNLSVGLDELFEVVRIRDRQAAA